VEGNMLPNQLPVLVKLGVLIFPDPLDEGFDLAAENGVLFWILFFFHDSGTYLL
jgi:hypothetical protein